MALASTTVSSLLRDLHWLRVPERIMYRLAVLVFRCRNHTAPEYLTRDCILCAKFCVPTGLQTSSATQYRLGCRRRLPRQRLRSATTHQLMVPRTRLRTVGNRAFGIAGARVWTDLPTSVVCAPSLAVFKKNLKTQFFGSPTSLTSTRSRVLVNVVTCP